MGSGLAVGVQAPDFTLPSTAGDPITLSELLSRGNVLLAFYLLDFTAPCATFLSRLAGAASKLTEMNTAVVGISVDSVYAHTAFARELKLPFPLASDFNRKVSASYGVLANQILGLKRLAKPALVLVAKDSTISYRWVSDDPLAIPSLQPVFDALSHLTAR